MISTVYLFPVCVFVCVRGRECGEGVFGQNGKYSPSPSHSSHSKGGRERERERGREREREREKRKREKSAFWSLLFWDLLLSRGAVE